MHVRVIAALGLIVAAGPLAAQQPNRLAFRSGGTMSARFELLLDLEHGDFTLTEGAVPVGPSGKEVTRSGMLDPARLSDLTARIRLAMRAGWESTLCKAERRRAHRRGELYVDMPHTPDYLASLTVTLDGVTMSPPNDPGCWSEQANALVDAAVEAARASAGP